MAIKACVSTINNIAVIKGLDSILTTQYTYEETMSKSRDNAN